MRTLKLAPGLLGYLGKALHGRRLVGTFHPAKPLRRLDVLLRRQRLRVIQCGGLDFDNPGQQVGVALEQTGTAIGTEIAERRAR